MLFLGIICVFQKQTPLSYLEFNFSKASHCKFEVLAKYKNLRITLKKKTYHFSKIRIKHPCTLFTTLLSQVNTKKGYKKQHYMMELEVCNLRK